MRKDFGVKTWIYPQPVLIIGTYDEDGTPNAMNAAWGAIYDDDQVVLCLSKGHRTTRNIKERKAFTLSFATADQVVPCDYVGITSGNGTPDNKGGLQRHTQQPGGCTAHQRAPACHGVRADPRGWRGAHHRTHRQREL